MSNIDFAYPGFLYLLLLVPAIIAFYVLKQQKAFASVKLPGLKPLELPVKTFRNWLRHLLFALRMATVSLLIIV
ncbi:MAG: aerotolerance regulator BatA, partial [Bacteroidales bacterium]|nr:aerotolerance regulator BatA [Bacteroidales bacterium]